MWNYLVRYFSQLDQKIFLEINVVFSNRLFDVLMPAVTNLMQFFWVKWLLLPAMILAICFFKRWWGVYYIVVVSLSVILTDFISHSMIKEFFQRTRPIHAGIGAILRTHEHFGYSFPSNHAANMYCFAVVSAYFLPRAAKSFYFWAFIVAYSRVYVGVHYPFDVIVGGCLGALVGSTSVKLCERLRKEMLWRKS